MQALCDQSPLNAVNYAALAGMKIAALPKHGKAILFGDPHHHAGNVFLVANASALVTPGEQEVDEERRTSGAPRPTAAPA